MLSNQRYQRAFTLIELLVTLTIAGILLMIAIPSFRDASVSSKLRSTANRLISSTLVSRSEAFKRNTSVQMCVSTDGASCTTGGWEQGWIIRQGLTVIDHQPAAPTGYHVTAGAGSTTLTFQPTGVGSTVETFTVCRATPVGSQERVVSLNSTGRSYATRTNAGVCP
jgi:type IV fimbrial biogenesis protein FimT